MSEPTTPSVDRKLVPLALGTAEWSWNVVTGEVSWSEGIEALFGLPRGAFAGTFEAYLALVHPEDQKYFQAVIARTMAGEDEYVMSHRVIWPDGSVRWIDGRGQLTRDASGRPLLLRGVAWSAPARKVAEARVHHLHRVQAVTRAVSRELLRVERQEEAFSLACRIAVEHGDFRFAWVGIIASDGTTLDPVARAGAEDGYLDEPAVATARSTLGQGPIGRSLRSGVPVVVNDTATEDMFAPWREPALRRGYLACGSFPFRRRDGRIVGTLVIYAREANRFDDDQIELLRGLADDIGFKLDALDAADRQRDAEEALRRSEERYRAVVEQADDAIFLTDPTGVVLEANTAAAEHMLRKREELIGRRISEMLDSPEEPVARRLAGKPPGTRVAAEQTLRRRDGSILLAEVCAVKLADGRVLGFSRDITERKKVERQLILADRLASLGRLAAGVAHEINNPLAYTMLSLERIERGAKHEDAGSPASLAEIRSAAEDARDGAERVRSIVRSLGAFSREEDGAVGAVDLAHVLENAVRMSESALRHRGRIVMRNESTRRVRGSELRLGQVFVNLLVNAADALPDETPERGRVEIHMHDVGEHVVVEVKDNGVGIAPTHLERVFDPFFTTKPVGEGTGLGLSISHGIVTSFGGQITVESKLGVGTTFKVSLLADTATVPAARESTERTKSGVRVLIVDDEPRLAQALAMLLEDHTVAVATSGREALDLTKAHTYDVILCDLMMAGVSGMDLYAELTRAGRGQERRMIFMTGGVCTTRARDFLSQSSSVLLEKPFGPGRVEEAIANLIGVQGRAPSSDPPRDATPATAEN